MALIRIKRSTLNRFKAIAKQSKVIVNNVLVILFVLAIIAGGVGCLIEFVQCLCGDPEAIEMWTGKPAPR
jgi:hypothetical protein